MVRTPPHVKPDRSTETDEGQSRPARAGKAVTIRDVAKVAGVSPITVSRALSRPELLTPETLERIRDVVARTGYVPNFLAGSLRSRRSRIVAAIFPQITNTMFVGTIQALTDRLHEEGYQLLLGLSSYEMREDELIAGILGRKPDGIYLTGISHAPETRRRLIAAHIPVVEAWDLTPTPIDMLVGFSHANAGAAMARHLVAKGHRRIGLVWGNDVRAGFRRNGFVAALADHEIHEAPTILSAAPAMFQRGREGFAKLLDLGARVTAVACSSDVLAQGAIAEAQDRGIRIPADLAVIGFGDFDFAAHTSPPLTSIAIDKAGIGRLAAEALLARIQGKEVSARIVDVGFQLVERGST
jgi:LacI family transcriptional regulator, gluconate utilization system Gnt-I transcriptional repressor